MTRDEAIEHVCATVAMAFHTIGDYSKPSDGFCHHCPAANYDDWNYQNAGHMLQYVRQAVREKLARDGYNIPPEYDPENEEY